MIVIDTHIWIWWAHGSSHLSASQLGEIEASEQSGVGVSAISCWEVAKLVALGRLDLDRPVGDWIGSALAYPGVRLLGLTPAVAVASTQLPGEFHRDPADQMIVATARVHGCRLVTSDRKIVDYPHVETIS